MQTDNETRMFSASAEQAVLGCLIVLPTEIEQVEFLSASMFYDQAHQKIFTAIKRLDRDNKPIDIITIAELLDKFGHLGGVGGIAYLGELAGSNIGSANLKRHGEIILEKSKQRNLHLTLIEALKNVEVGKDIQNTISQAVASLNSVLEASISDEPTRISELLEERFDRIEKLQQGELKPIQTGFSNFDEKFGGLHGGDLIILAGRPSMGKTALGVQIAEQIQSPKKPSLVFSCEMADGQLIDRMITGNSRVSSNRMFREAGMLEDDWTNLMAAVPKLNDMNLFIDDKATKLSDMRAKAKLVKRKHGLGLIVIDYLQLMEGEGDSRHGNREQEISAISRGLKKLAKELDVPVIALSQLSRRVEERQDKRPQMSDLRESGAIEQDADMILFVYRDEYYNQDTQYKGTAEIINAKNRNGETGKVFLTFDNEFTRFKVHNGAEPTYDKVKSGSYRGREFRDD